MQLSRLEIQERRHKASRFKWLTIIAPYLLILLSAILILIPQFSSHAMFLNSDTYFHMNRLYDTMMQIKTGHFSYFASWFGFNGVGRITNAIYGPIWAYLNGLILLILPSWYSWELFESILLMTVGGITMYLLVRYIGVNRILGTILAILYVYSYNLQLGVIYQEFTSIGASLMPLAVLVGWKMVREKKINVTMLVSVMVLLAQVHLLSLLISAVMLIPFFFTALYHTQYRQRMLKKLAKAIGITIALTANVWGSILEITLSNHNHFIPPFPIFNFIKDPYAHSLTWSHNALTVLQPMPIFTIIAITVLVLTILSFWKQSANFKIATLTCLFFGWLASVWFPWESIQKTIPWIDSTLQQPRRFIIVANILFFAIIASLLTKHGTRILTQLIHLPSWTSSYVQWLFAILLITAGGFTAFQIPQLMKPSIQKYQSNLPVAYGYFRHYYQHNPRIIRQHMHTKHLTYIFKDIAKGNTDYLPTRYHLSNIHNYFKFKPYYLALTQLSMYHMPNAQRTFLPHAKHQLKFYYHPKKSREMLVPMVKYAHTKVVVNHHVYHVRPDDVSNAGGIIVPVHHGINTVQEQYQPPTIFKCLMGICILSWLDIMVVPFATFSVAHYKQWERAQRKKAEQEAKTSSNPN